MKSNGLTLLIASLKDIPDPRVVGRTAHALLDILVLAVCAILAGADDWEAIELWGEAKLDFLRGYLELENGIPSHDTIGRVFGALNSKAFQTCFINWAGQVCGNLEGQVIAIDGKSSRGSHHHRLGKKAIHLVSAFASAQGLTLGQCKTAEKSNEITAIPELLAMLDLKGGIVTIDSMGCQTAIAHAIVEQKADYVLALKGNQGNLHDQVREFFDTAGAHDYRGLDVKAMQVCETCEKGHGRIETRRVSSLSTTHLEQVGAWSGLRSMTMVESTRQMGDQCTTEKRYYISSLAPDAAKIGQAIRAHWAIENTLHWSLDVSFKEDHCRVRIKNAAENFNILRKITMNLLKLDRSTKRSIPKKRYLAALDHQFLAKILGMPTRTV
jgi:predicted transposase YbfD/YdcC